MVSNPDSESEERFALPVVKQDGGGKVGPGPVFQVFKVGLGFFFEFLYPEVIQILELRDFVEPLPNVFGVAQLSRAGGQGQPGIGCRLRRVIAGGVFRRFRSGQGTPDKPRNRNDAQGSSRAKTGNDNDDNGHGGEYPVAPSPVPARVGPASGFPAFVFHHVLLRSPQQQTRTAAGIRRAIILVNVQSSLEARFRAAGKQGTL